MAMPTVPAEEKTDIIVARCRVLARETSAALCGWNAPVPIPPRMMHAMSAGRLFIKPMLEMKIAATSGPKKTDIERFKYRSEIIP